MSPGREDSFGELVLDPALGTETGHDEVERFRVIKMAEANRLQPVLEALRTDLGLEALDDLLPRIHASASGTQQAQERGYSCS